MPKMITVGPSTSYKPETAVDKAVFEEIKKKGSVLVPYQTALENVRNSKGMYAIEREAQVKAASVLESKATDELKLMMAALGVPPRKIMKRTDMIKVIQKKLDEIQVEED